jgi:predicted TIM-barrel fold metal-dependent hydrolase
MSRVCLPAKTTNQAIAFKPPPFACDSHVHVFGPYAKFPLSDDRSYTPGEYLANDFLSHLERIGFTRGVLVTASVCGTNNGAILEAMQNHTSIFRGIVVCDADVSEAELDQWHALGVRGIRFNLLRKNGQALYRNGVGLEVLEAIAPKMAARGWHAQIWVHAPDLPELSPRLLKLGLSLVVDHMGRMDTVHGIHHPGFEQLCRMVGDGTAWVKISGGDRIRAQHHHYHDVDAFATSLIKANIERVVWGSDWPHINYFEEKELPDDGDLTNLLLRWLPHERDRQQVLVNNPTILYDF